MEYQNNTLFNIQTNQLVLKNSIFPEHLEIETVENKDFLFTELNENTVAEDEIIHQDVSALIDFLSIGSFIVNEMIIGNGLKEADYNTLKNSRTYPILIDKISIFLKKYGMQNGMQNIKGLKISILALINASVDRYHWYSFIDKFRQKEQTNNSSGKSSKNLYQELRGFGKLTFNSFESRLFIMPSVTKAGIKIRYTFESLFDLIDYQFILFLGNTQNYDIGICPYCNTFFIKKSRDKIYCKPEHSNAARLRDNQLKPDFATVKYCKLDECRKPFTPSHQRQEYCDPKCKKRAEYLKAKEKRKSEYEW